MTGIERHWREEQIERLEKIREKLDELAQEFPELKEDGQILMLWFENASGKFMPIPYRLYRARYAGKF